MKKLLTYSLFCIALSSCTQDDDRLYLHPSPTLPPEQPTPNEALLGIHPIIAGIQPVSRGIITEFTDNDRIGLFITDGALGTNYQGNTDAANVPATYFKGNWKVDKDIVLTSSATAFAYYPYNGLVADGADIPIEIASQTDYLYARSAYVDVKSPVAQVGMRHALSLVSVRIRKNDYQHTGKLTKIEVLDIQTAGTLNIATGEIKSTGNIDTYTVDKNLILDDVAMKKTQMILLPVDISKSTGNIRFQITIDDKSYIWEVPKSHVWEAGKEYTYTLNLSKIPEEVPSLELDVDYWRTYGKDDNIQIEDHTKPGSAYYRTVDVQMGSTDFGRTVVQGEAFVFTGVVYDRKDGFKGRVKYSLWKDGKMVEQFPSYYFECNIYTTLEVPCFITAAPGTYQLRMLLKEEGSNTWFLPSDRYSEPQDWIFTVQADNTTPSLRSMTIKGGFKPYLNTVQFAQLNKPFNMEFTLTNRATVPLKGEIKAVWHRTFTGEFYLPSENDGTATWEDEIGRMFIELPVEKKEYKGLLPCTITINRTYPKKWAPTVSFYYKAENSNTWKLMRSDADSELQRWLDADKDKVIMGSYDNPDKSWYCLGGDNFQFIDLE